ncbi:MAG: hypothetical protein AN488_03060 [Anabaena sp. WA113]|nr:MAG: hypothetical protein AN488_03060 [Anabaena sp. WA113]
MSNLFTAVSVEQQEIVAGGIEIPSIAFASTTATTLAVGPGAKAGAISAAFSEVQPSNRNRKPNKGYGRPNRCGN